MKSQPSVANPTWTIDHLVEALHNMRDAWTRVSLELHDIQFDLDTLQRHQAMEHASDLVDKAKSK